MGGKATREQRRRYELAHPDRVRESKRRWEQANRARQNEWLKQWRRDNPEKVRAQKRRTYERYAERNREYQRERIRKMGPEAASAMRRRYYLANLEKMRAYHVRAVAVRRALKKNNGTFLITERDIARLLDRYRQSCAWCLLPLPDRWHLDHVIPLTRGGRHSIGNLVPACAPCNQSKTNKLPVEWRR